MRIAVPLAGLLFLAARPAYADAVPPPPTQCPPGTRGETNHVMQYCGPATCRTDAECGEGQVCAHYPLCVSRLVSHSPRGDSHSAPVHGPCDEGKCDEGSCEANDHCVPRDFLASGKAGPAASTAGAPNPGATGTPLPGSTSGAPAQPPPARPSHGACSCRLGAPDDPGALVALLAGVGLLGARTRRRRARHGA